VSPTVRAMRPPQPASPISVKSLVRAAEEGVGKDPDQRAPDNCEEELAAAATAERSVTFDEIAAKATAAVETVSPEVEETAAECHEVPQPPQDEAAAPTDEDEVIQVGFENGSTGDIEVPPPVKRVHVSNQIDILAELDGLRKRATMSTYDRDFSSTSPDLDLDSLLSSASPLTREMRKRLERTVNSNVFSNMRGVQFAIRIQGKDGETIHTFDPVSLDIDEAGGLKRISLHLSLDLENLR